MKRLEEGQGGSLKISQADRDAAAAIAEECEALGIGIVGWFDEDFPRRLKSIPDPPAILFYRGEIGIANRERAVAIVGTRAPTKWGRAATRVITDRFAQEEWVIVSGLARGVDTVAHERALEQIIVGDSRRPSLGDPELQSPPYLRDGRVDVVELAALARERTPSIRTYAELRDRSRSGAR